MKFKLPCLIHTPIVGSEGDLLARDEAFSVTLQDVLLFSTGAAEVPPIGFQPTPALTFHDDGLFPWANTCSNTLSLSLEHGQYEEYCRLRQSVKSTTYIAASSISLALCFMSYFTIN